MRSRTIVLGLLATALAIPTTMSTPAGARRAADDAWTDVPATWAGPRQAVNVVDVKVLGNRAYAVGNTRKAGVSRPWVQTCKARSCTRKALPRPGRRSTSVASISGAAPTDMWAVGTYRVGKVLRPVMWRKTGATWRIFNSGITVKDKAEKLQLTQIEVANKSKAFALGRYNYLDGVTSTLYRWNGTDWKELASRANPSQFDAPCNRWFYRKWSDIVVRSGVAMLVGSCRPQRSTTWQRAVIDQGDDGTWSPVSGGGFPKNAAFTRGEFIWQEAFLFGTRSGKRVIYKQSGNSWTAVTTKGLGPKAVVSDLAGPFENRLMAVGWVRSDRRHKEASAWLLSKSGWRATNVPGGVSRSRLLAVSVDAKSRFFAVGSDTARKPAKRGLIIRTK